MEEQNDGFDIVSSESIAEASNFASRSHLWDSNGALSASATPAPVHISLFPDHQPSGSSSSPPSIRAGASDRLDVPAPFAASNNSRALSMLSGSPVENASRTAAFDSEPDMEPSISSVIPRVEKDIDDPTASAEARRSGTGSEYNTLTTLSRLFAGHSSPAPSRVPSYAKPTTGLTYLHNLQTETTSLTSHLYNRGLLGGRHSDITIVAFGHRYALHRIILDRAPFFTGALSEPWVESTAREVTLHPEDIDQNITQTAFEMALKLLYGCDISAEEDDEAVGLFAVGCWLEMQDLIDLSIESILRQMNPETLSPLIRLVTANYYGRAGERILASCKAMLCREGWEMPLYRWDGIPGDIVKEIVGGDGLFVESEWERWVLAKRITDRKLRSKAIELGLLEPSKRFTTKAPSTLTTTAVRLTDQSPKKKIADGHEKWLSLYTSPDVDPFLQLMDEGIYYVHLDFEQLQFIRQTRDIFGFPVVPEKVVTIALWMQMELRQKVANADESELELGLSKPAKCLSGEISQPVTGVSEISSSKHTKGKQPVHQEAAIIKNEEAAGDDEHPRKFWIPSTDCNIVMGGSAEPVVTTSTSTSRHVAGLTKSQGEDTQWSSGLPSSTNPGNPHGSARPNQGVTSSANINIPGRPKPITYTHYPPFRFSAEFPNPRLLKEKKRVYSRTVFYAGSLWNIYIQKVKSSKSPQLGVYLHRVKECDTEEVISGSTGLAHGSIGSVDERIGVLEREMLLRSERRDRRRTRPPMEASDIGNTGGEDDTSGSSGDGDTTLMVEGARNSIFNTPASGRYRQSGMPVAGMPSSTANAANPNPGPTRTLSFPNSAGTNIVASGSETEDESYENPSLSLLVPRKSRGRIATIPPYVDTRPTIKTYFKIYSPSKGGKLLSVYESAPDQFNFSQSWGWRSTTLLLDETPMGMGSGRLEYSIGDDSPVGRKKASLRHGKRVKPPV